MGGFADGGGGLCVIASIDCIGVDAFSAICFPNWRLGFR